MASSLVFGLLVPCLISPNISTVPWLTACYGADTQILGTSVVEIEALGVCWDPFVFLTRFPLVPTVEITAVVWGMWRSSSTAPCGRVLLFVGKRGWDENKKLSVQGEKCFKTAPRKHRVSQADNDDECRVGEGADWCRTDGPPCSVLCFLVAGNTVASGEGLKVQPTSSRAVSLLNLESSRVELPAVP